MDVWTVDKKIMTILVAQKIGEKVPDIRKSSNPDKLAINGAHPLGQSTKEF